MRIAPLGRHPLACVIAVLIALLVLAGVSHARPGEAWEGTWPIQAPLDIEQVGTIEHEGVTIQRLRYTGSMWKGNPHRVYALYAHPKTENGVTRFPAVIQIHGGGQSCTPQTVAWFVSQGYACLALDWGGPRDNRPLDEVTTFAPGLSTSYMDPAPEGPKQMMLMHAVLSARRAVDVLQSFPEIDGEHIGAQGVSWGGLVAWLVGAQEPRLKALVPVYGVGGLAHADSLEGIVLRQESPTWVNAWSEAFDPLNYAAHQRVPLMFLNATNDGFGLLCDAETMLAGVPVEHRRSYVANGMHWMDPDAVAAGMAWFDHWLKGGPALPAEPRVTLFADEQHRLCARVAVDTGAGSKSPDSVHINYARGDVSDVLKCWLTQPARRIADGNYVAELPTHDDGVPIAVMGQARYAPGYTLSSVVVRAIPGRDVPGVATDAAGTQTLMISDWNQGPSGWFIERSTDFHGVHQPAGKITTTTLEQRPALVLSSASQGGGFELRTRLTADAARRRDHALPLEIWTHDVARMEIALNRGLRQPGSQVHVAVATPGPGWQLTRLECTQFQLDPPQQGTPSALSDWQGVFQMNFSLTATPDGRAGLGSLSWSETPDKP